MHKRLRARIRDTRLCGSQAVSFLYPLLFHVRCIRSEKISMDLDVQLPFLGTADSCRLPVVRFYFSSYCLPFTRTAFGKPIHRTPAQFYVRRKTRNQAIGAYIGLSR